MAHECEGPLIFSLVLSVFMHARHNREPVFGTVIRHSLRNISLPFKIILTYSIYMIVDDVTRTSTLVVIIVR